MKIGVFDSGIGGKAIADDIAAGFPEAEVRYVNDSKNVPYGSRTSEEIMQLTESAIQPLLKSRCDVVVLACNTATAAAIEYLRKKYPEEQFIGLEPMVKTAVSKTKSGIVAICASPFTLASERYLKLKQRHAENVLVIEPDCGKWAYMIETNSVDIESIRKTVSLLCDQGADVIVLACTHYHWIESEIRSVANGRALIIKPSEAIVERIRQLTTQNTL